MHPIPASLSHLFRLDDETDAYHDDFSWIRAATVRRNGSGLHLHTSEPDEPTSPARAVSEFEDESCEIEVDTTHLRARFTNTVRRQGQQLMQSQVVLEARARNAQLSARVAMCDGRQREWKADFEL